MFKAFAVLLLSLVMSSCMHARFNENNFLRPIQEVDLTITPPKGYQLKNLVVDHKDGEQSFGVAITHPNNTINIMYFGGNMMTIEKHGSAIINILTKLNANVMIFDHRGYGQSTGKPTVALLKSDAIDNYDDIRENYSGIIILHGQSLGSFEVGAIAGSRKVDALVLESSATNIDQWIKKVMPWYVKPFVKVEVSENLRTINNETILNHSTSPLMILVGEDDKQTPVSLSQALFKASIAKHKQIHILKGSSHNNVPENPKFLEVYRAFINQLIN